MKIFQIITRSDTVGGAQNHVLDLSISLKKQKDDVTVISSGDGIFFDRILKNSITYFNLKDMRRNISFMSDIRAIFKLRVKIKKEKPDVVALHSVKAGLIGRIACLGINTKVFFTAHGWSHIRNAKGVSRLIYSSLELFLSFLCKKVICVSQADLDFAKSNLYIPEAKLELIYNGVKLDKTPDKTSPNESNMLNLLSVTRFQEPKDFDTLLISLASLKNEQWNLNFVGEGEDLDKVKLEVIRLGLKDKIFFEGFQDNLTNYYERADLVILISKSEGMPLALLEAMSFSKLIVASNVGGIPELIESGENGYLIEQSDIKSLSKAIKNIIDMSNEQRTNMGANSFVRFKKQFQFSSMLTKILLLYKSE
tara:strand:+ start:16322 stop:17419 length:1098 start_codon:yes stop_codon:yes gene_type:complete